MNGRRGYIASLPTVVLERLLVDERRRVAPWRLRTIEKFDIGGRNEALAPRIIGYLDPTRAIIFLQHMHDALG